MSREALAIGSDTKPPVLFCGDYAQWKTRFLDFVDRQELCDEILESISEGPKQFYVEIPVADDEEEEVDATGQAVPRVARVLKDKSKLSFAEQNRLKGDKLARSYLLMGLPNDIYNNIDSHKTAKAMWDEVEKQMQGSEMTSRAKITNVLTSYEGFRQKDGELLSDTYNRYCNILNDLRRNNFHKQVIEINIKFLNNLQPEWKRFSMNITQNRDLKEEDIHHVFETLNLNQEEVLELQGKKSSSESTSADPLALVANRRHAQPHFLNPLSQAEKLAILGDNVSENSTDSDSDPDMSEMFKAMALFTKTF